MHLPQNGTISFDPQQYSLVFCWVCGVEDGISDLSLGRSGVAAMAAWLTSRYGRGPRPLSRVETGPGPDRGSLDVRFSVVLNMAVGQNQWYHVGVGAPPILISLF